MTTSTTFVTAGTIANGLVKTKVGDRECYATESQVDTLDVLGQTTAGGFATVHGYKPTTDWVKVPTVNINFISRFSTQKLYDRKLKALQDVKYSDLNIIHPKLIALSDTDRHQLFLDCVSKMLASMQKTLDGDRSDNYRKAHDTFYATDSQGVKVHFFTDKINGETQLILHNGLPVIKSVMLSIIEIGRKTVVEGERKVVKSGVKVLMDQAINKAIKSKTVAMKTISLKEDNFDKVTIGGQMIDPDHANSVFAIVN